MDRLSLRPQLAVMVAAAAAAGFAADPGAPATRHERVADAAPIRWLVVGAGRAGRIRARDIGSEAGHRLHAHLPGRAPAEAIYAAISSPSVDAIAICVENARHGELAAAALRAGKHALVEFPLCHTAAGAYALLHVAGTANLTLHLELIGLLAEGHLALRRRAREEGIESLRVEFRGGLYGWVADEAAACRWGQLAVGRLHALWDICGPLRVASVALRVADAGGYELTVHLVGAGGESIVLIERRASELARGVTWTGLDGRGAPIDRPRASGGVPLFLQDLRLCGARIRGDAAATYVDDAAVLGVAALAERISKQARRRLQAVAPGGDWARR